MNPHYAKARLKQVTGEEYDIREDREMILAMSDALAEAYKAGQNNPHGSYWDKLAESQFGGHVREIHAIGKHVIIENTCTRQPDEPILYGVWLDRARKGKGGVVCHYYSMEEALLSSISLHADVDKEWTTANQDSHYAGMILGLKPTEES